MAEPVLKDLGLENLRKDLARLKGQSITIGPQGDSGQARHPGAKSASVADVAAWMEFGTKKVPMRPFIRTTFDQNEAKIAGLVKTGLSDLIDGRRKIRQIQDKIGEEMLTELRRTLGRSRDWAAPLAQATIDRKGHDQPLLDSGTITDKSSWAVRGPSGTIKRQAGET